MKKLLYLLFVAIVMCIGVSVYAIEYQPSNLIAANEVATVDTDMFSYNNISYVSAVSGKNYGRFQFQSIVNKTTKKVPVSINILLFDQDQKNIGFVTYCSESDYDGEFAQKQMKAGETFSFSINVTSRYFASDKTPADVSYYAVLDDNPYCHVGGYDKYAGLTMEEIASGGVANKSEKTSFDFNYDVFQNMNSSFIAFIVGVAIGLLIAFIVQGLILNALYKRMFAITSAMSYLPLLNYYVAVKLAFGSKVAKIYIILLFLSVPLLLLKLLGIIYYILCFVGGIAFIIDIIKLITKKYSMCYLEPYTNGNIAVGGTFAFKQDVHPEPVKEEDNSESQSGIFIQTGDHQDKTDSVQTDSNEKEGFDNNEPSLLDEDDDVKPEPKEEVKEGESELMDLFK